MINLHRMFQAKRQRLLFIAILLTLVAISVTLILQALRQNIVFFLTPTMLVEGQARTGQQIRLGGQVVEGSLIFEGAEIYFTLSDGDNQVDVVYRGILPDLFREGQGVIAEGALRAEMPFHATHILAKHDENYIPREIVETLKQEGQWQDSSETKASPD